jgi:glycosyltransferase involved in cell wall biosynthesis
MLRVLTLSTLFPDEGRPAFGVFVERQTLALAERGDVEVVVAAPVGLPPWPLTMHNHYRGRARLPLKEDWKGLEVHRPRFRVWPRMGEAGAGRSLAKALLPLVRDLRVDVVAAQFFWPDGVAAMHLAQALGLPFSIKARGADIHYWGKRRGIGPQVAEAGLRANGLLAVSGALKADMAALGMPEEKIRIHYTGIDRERFRPVDRAQAKAALGVEGPLLVTAGALIPRKGQKLTIEALAAVPEATLLVVGGGPDRAELEALAASLGLGPRVRFLGPLPHDELPPLIAAADVMMLPSVSEGLANVWVEALACGTPLVISDAGGAREALDRPEAGRMVAREPGAIAAAVRDILADPPAQEAVRAAADRFSWERNAAELAEHLRSLGGLTETSFG